MWLISIALLCCCPAASCSVCVWPVGELQSSLVRLTADVNSAVGVAEWLQSFLPPHARTVQPGENE